MNDVTRRSRARPEVEIVSAVKGASWTTRLI